MRDSCEVDRMERVMMRLTQWNNEGCMRLTWRD